MSGIKGGLISHAAIIRESELAVIRAARRYHDIATNHPVVSDEWMEAWRALGAELEALDYVEFEAGTEIGS